MTVKPGSAAILGGGIGGLTAANTLLRHGWHIDVFERSPEPPRTGTALGMWPPALAALEVAGVGGRVEQLGVTQRSATLRRWDGVVLAHVGDLRRAPVMVSRPALLDILLSGLPDHIVKFDAPAPPLTALAGYDVMIGADGIGSAVRDEVFGPAYRPVHTGYGAWRGWVGGSTTNHGETWGPGALFGITDRDGDLTNWFAAVRTTEGTGGTLDDLYGRFHDWHPGVRDILGRLDPDDVMYHDLYESPRLPSYVLGNTALIGDAAHAMAPNLGRGACEAIVDATTLATLLSEHPVPIALQRYDRARRRRTQLLVPASRAVARIATASRLASLRDSSITAFGRIA